MKRYERLNPKRGELKMILEEYKDFGEFQRTLDARPIVWTDNSEPSRDEIDPSFKGCASYENAREMLTHGYNKSVERMVKKVNALQKTGTVRKTERFMDVVGYQPIVPLALIGVPTSMMNQRKVEVKSKIITVNYDCGVTASHKPKEVLDFGCEFINWCLNLENRGFRVKINYIKTFNPSSGDTNRQYVLAIPLKNENQPLNVKRLSFALTHVAMQRYLSWDWVERLPKSEPMYGFGRSLSAWSEDSKFHKNIKDYYGDSSLLVTFGMNLEKVFGGVK